MLKLPGFLNSKIQISILQENEQDHARQESTRREFLR